MVGLEYDLETSTMRRSGRTGAVEPRKEKKMQILHGMNNIKKMLLQLRDLLFKPQRCSEVAVSCVTSAAAIVNLN